MHGENLKLNEIKICCSRFAPKISIQILIFDPQINILRETNIKLVSYSSKNSPSLKDM